MGTGDRRQRTGGDVFGGRPRVKSERGWTLPACLADVDARFMTAALRESGVIDVTNGVVALDESGVGLTAGYFSDIKRVRCTYLHRTDAPARFVVKAWPAFEIMPKVALRGYFVKDISAYHLAADRFYPRVGAVLAEADPANSRWAMVMDDADAFAEHKAHESDMTLDDVMRMIPKLVDVAVAWEGCDRGERADELAGLGVDFWASDDHLGPFKARMPGGAKLFDYVTTMASSSLTGGRAWDRELGPGTAELFTRRLGAFYAGAHPENGATCTLSHGDLRGDNIFFCQPSRQYPHGWLCIDFQMFRGPVPSDLAYLMGTGTVRPDVYGGENLQLVLRTFYEQFRSKTSIYQDYSYDQFRPRVRAHVHRAFRLRGGNGRGDLAGRRLRQRTGGSGRTGERAGVGGRVESGGATPAHVVAQAAGQLPPKLQDVRPVRVREGPPGELGRAGRMGRSALPSAMNGPSGTVTFLFTDILDQPVAGRPIRLRCTAPWPRMTPC